jgi:signal transduction histidine kinase
MSVVESGDTEQALAPVDPEVALGQALDACLGLIRTGGVRLLDTRTVTGVRVEGNLARLSQVFINILSNAIKYNDNPAPVITVDSRVEGGDYVAVIGDNGAGIPAEDARSIFEKFSRGRSAGAQSGAGLGLAISHAIVARSGGTLRLLPDAGGARFEVRLPLLTSEAEPLA